MVHYLNLLRCSPHFPSDYIDLINSHSHLRSCNQVPQTLSSSSFEYEFSSVPSGFHRYPPRGGGGSQIVASKPARKRERVGVDIIGPVLRSILV